MAELGPGSPRGGENSPLDFMPSRGDPNPHHGLFSRCAQISSGSASSRLRINLKPARSPFSVLPGPPDRGRCLCARRRPRTFKPKLTRSPGPAEGPAPIATQTRPRAHHRIEKLAFELSVNSTVSDGKWPSVGDLLIGCGRHKRAERFFYV